MKRCPECEFLYEDDQDHCEMDGTRLFFTTALPPLPAGLKPPKSIWGGLTIPLLAALILGTVLAILYRATPRAYSSSSPAAAVQTQPPMQKSPQANQESESAAADTSQTPAEAAEESSSPSDDAAKDPFDARKAHPDKPDTSAATADEKVPTPAPAMHIEAAPNSQPVNPVTTEAKPAAGPPTLVNQVSPAGQKSAPASSSASSHPKPPAWAGSPQPAQNANKDSKVNSFFKKAGKVLKKPFEN